MAVPPVLKACAVEGTSSEDGGLPFTLHCRLLKKKKTVRKKHTQKMLLWPLSVCLCLPEFLTVEEERIAGSLHLLLIT